MTVTKHTLISAELHTSLSQLLLSNTLQQFVLGHTKLHFLYTH
ncbi:hypothetical protein KUCAC02_026227 [Chaenocephalus aceratus]|nr:hypothetical protein KUCAC02_026227 [Chaenocephalus aceratus]